MIDFENRGPLAAAGGGPATISWQSKYATNASTTSIDSGTIAIGDDTDPHHCIVAVYQRLNSIPRPTSVQVDGQSCSLITGMEHISSPHGIWLFITDAEITSVTGAVTMTTGTNTRMGLDVFDVRNLSSSTPIDSFAGGTTFNWSDTFTSDADGFAIAYVVFATSNSSTITYITGLTETSNYKLDGNFGRNSSGVGTPTGATHAMTVNGTTSSGYFCVATMR